MDSIFKFNILEKNNLTKRLKAAIDGDFLERQQLIEDYMPFIIKTITTVTKKYVEVENSEELSLGMIAFNHALDTYHEDKGNFINYAEILIKNRIIDYLRKEVKHEAMKKQVEIIDLKDHKDDFSHQLETKEEILRLKEVLKVYDITFEDLVTEKPKHKKTRQKCLQIGRTIATNKSLKNVVMIKKVLPIKTLVDEYGFQRKTLKNNKKYIITIVLVYDEDLEIIKHYIIGMEGSEKSAI